MTQTITTHNHTNDNLNCQDLQDTINNQCAYITAIAKWESTGCFVNEDRYIYSVVLSRWIGRLRLDGEPDKRFRCDGEYSVMNHGDVNFNHWITKHIPDEYWELKDLDNIIYKRWWKQREDIITNSIGECMTPERLEAMFRELNKLKNNADNIIHLEESRKFIHDIRRILHIRRVR